MMKSDARRSLTDLRASLYFIIFFKRKELTTNAPSFAVRRQFLLLSRKRRGLEVARRIFLVQSRRNQWLSRFACTKAAADFRRRGAFSWCKADVINGFPGLLAPRPTPVSGGGTGREASYFFRGFPFAPVRFRNSCLRFPASSLRFRFAVFGFITEKPKKPRGSLLRA